MHGAETSASSLDVSTATARAPFGRFGRAFRRRSATDRPRTLWVVSSLTILFLFLPIVVVVVFSFNSSKSLMSMAGLSFRWYSMVVHDPTLLAIVQISLADSARHKYRRDRPRYSAGLWIHQAAQLDRPAK